MRGEKGGGGTGWVQAGPHALKSVSVFGNVLTGGQLRRCWVCVRPRDSSGIKRAPKQNSLSPLESNPSVLLISEEWRHRGWGWSFIYSEKHKQMSNMVLTKRRGGGEEVIEGERGAGGGKILHILVKKCSIMKHARSQIQISSLRLAAEANSSSVEPSFELIRSSYSRVSTCKSSL